MDEVDGVRDVARYVPRAASEWDERSAPWQVVDGSLVFVDISGFTNLSERLTAFGRIGAEELTEVLNRVFGAMLDLAYGRGGSLLKFGGDALLLLFSGPGHALQACAAAVEMRTALRTARGEVTSAGRLQLNLSIGVHSGAVQLFLAGSSHRELVVAGPAASLTTRMEKTADAGEIVISSATRAALPAGAADTAKDDGWLLRWRRPPVAPTGPVVRGAPSGGDPLLLLPVGLRDHLAVGDAEPEHRVANIAFVRFSGLDAVLRDGGGDAGWRAIDELVTAVQAAVDAEGVTFLATDIDADGGKVILTTGVPTTVEDDEGRILRAARRIADSPTTLRTHIGVNRGHVYAGEVGTAYRCAYTVMGDTVNLAARLMAAAPAGHVYAAPSVLDGSRTVFAASALEPFLVKGKAQPVHAYAVGDETGVRGVERAGDLPYKGRAAELAAVQAVLGRAGDPVVTVVGAEGMGKTRLAEEALATGPAVDAFVVRGEPYAVEVAYRALRYPLRSLLGLSDLAPAAMPEALLRAVVGIDPTLVPFLPLLADVVHVEVDATAEASAIGPRFRRERLAQVVEQVLVTTLASPAAIVVDDAHWLDEASAELLSSLADAAEGRAWSMIVLRRDQPGGFVPHRGATIALQPLPDPDAQDLVVAATTAAPLRPHDVAVIVDRAGGNPMYLQELVRAVRVTGMEELPDTLDATVAAQIDRLPPLARRILRLAAVLGRTFPAGVLDEVLAEEHLTLDRSTESQLADFLEREGALQLRFRHALLQEVAYEELSYRRRREVHGLAGEAIERLNRDDPDRAADVLGLHFERAHRHADAWRYAPVAGDAAARAHAHTEAAAHYARALAAARRLPHLPAAARAELWARLGDAREQSGVFDLALDAYRRAVRLVRGDATAEATMLLKRARARERAGAYSSALADVTAGLRRLEGAEESDAAALRARLHAFRAVVRQAQGRMAEALAVARVAAEHAERAGDDWSLASSYAVMDWVHLATGRLDDVRMGRSALHIYERLDDLEGQGKVMNTMGAAAYYRGDWDEAISWYERARAIGLRTGNHVQAAISAMNIGEIHVNEGRYDDADVVLHDAIRVFRASSFRDGQALAETYLGRSLLGRGELAAAREVLEGARQTFDSLGIPGGALEAATHLADCLVQAGEPEQATAVLDDAVGRANGDVGVLAASIARVRAAAFAAVGNLTDATGALLVGLDAARRQQLAYEERLLIDLRDAIDLSDQIDTPA